MVHASSVSPERRARLRRLRAEFEAALDAMGEDDGPGSPAYEATDRRYRTWVKAVDEVAIQLLDDIDAFEAAGPGAARAGGQGPSPGGRAEPVDLDRLFSGLDDLQRTVDLIGAAPPPAAPRRSTATSRAMSVIGNDRAARQWRSRGGFDPQGLFADEVWPPPGR